MPLDSALASIFKAIPSMPRTDPGPGGMPPGGAAPAPGMPPGAIAGGGGTDKAGVGGDVFTAAINKKLSEGTGTDPEHVVNVLREMKATIAALIPKVAFRMAGVDKHLNPAYRAIDNALQEAQKAMQQVAAQRPIDFSGANAGPQIGGGPPASVPL